jgi:non-ribosomal peptide synthetase component F
MLTYGNHDELSALLQQQGSAMYTSLIDTTQFIRLKELARASYCSVSAIAYASFYIFFYLYPRKARLLFAILMADRDTREKQSIIGSLLGAIYLPATVSGEKTITALVKETFLQLLEASQHTIYDHETIQLDGRALWLNCDLYLNYMTVNKEMLATGFYRKDHTEDENIFYALNCMLIEYSDGLCINWRYNTGLFTKELIEDMAHCHESIVQYITSHPNCTVNEIKDHFSAGVQTGNIL